MPAVVTSGANQGVNRYVNTAGLSRAKHAAHRRERHAIKQMLHKGDEPPPVIKARLTDSDVL